MPKLTTTRRTVLAGLSGAALLAVTKGGFAQAPVALMP